MSPGPGLVRPRQGAILRKLVTVLSPAGLVGMVSISSCIQEGVRSVEPPARQQFAPCSCFRYE